MAENEFVRIEVGLDGGQVLSWLVKPASADALDRALAAGETGLVSLEGHDGTIQLVLARIMYAKRYAREGRVGFEV